MSEGLGASARAMATRCCSPPESWPGKCASRCDKPDLGKRRARRVEGIVAVEEFERQRHVLERGHGRHEMEGLEHDADIGGTEPREPVLVEPGIVGVQHLHAAFAWRVRARR